jgi:hypothetical protein
MTEGRMNGHSHRQPKDDRRPARGLWAPGLYHAVCEVCDAEFCGGSEAFHCADCAYEQ